MAMIVIFFNFANIMNTLQKRYIQSFGIVVIILAIVRCAHPEFVGGDTTSYNNMAGADSVLSPSDSASFVVAEIKGSGTDSIISVPYKGASRFFKADGSLVKNRIYSVPHFGNTFPDQNDVQLEAATRLGVKAVVDRADAERRKSELVYVGNNPFFHVDRLKSSLPYLVPRAAVLLQDIGSAFFDSLQIKQIPLHKIIVTSVLRSKADVAKLRNHNSNATENSCHLYGTTFDVCYNRYKTVQEPDGPARRAVRNDTLKWVLAEVLNDMRCNNRCLVKYEVKQGCFHITVK